VSSGSFKTGSKAKIQPHHADKLQLQLAALDNAKSPKDMNAPGWRLHSLARRSRRPLVGGCQRQLASDVYGFEGEDAVLVDYHDYH
jgi:toxin HigB-1